MVVETTLEEPQREVVAQEAVAQAPLDQQLAALEQQIQAAAVVVAVCPQVPMVWAALAAPAS